MEALTARTPLHAEDGTDTARTTDISRTLAVTATYLLSEEGRKASLLTGGDGRAVQQLTLQVPANRLHLVAVDANGIARLKLQPRYHRDDDGVVRLDAPPTYDAPPDLETLFFEAARNHQLEQAYESERRAAKATRRTAEAERRAQVAQTFLQDATQRALVHPAPTPTRCYLATDRGRVMFDARTDESPTKDVPSEAHRRFRADLRVRQDENRRVRTDQLIIHEEKKRIIAAWIGTHGTPDQQVRQAAGVLPMDEAIRGMTDQAFAAVANRSQYVRDGTARLQEHLRQIPKYADVVITRAELQVTSTHASTASASQWALVQELQQAFPAATVTLRMHRLAWTRDRTAPAITVYGVLVTQKCGPLTLRREFAAPGDEFAS